MNVPRALFLLVMIAALSLTVVALRTEQVRVGAHIAELQRERLALRRTAWELELEISRLRSPGHIRDRVARWSLDVVEPGPPGDVTRETRLVLRR